MTLLPESFGDLEALILRFSHQATSLPDLMQLPMMTAAEGHREFIADLQSNRSGWANRR